VLTGRRPLASEVIVHKYKDQVMSLGDELNPYQPPKARLEETLLDLSHDLGEAEAIRRKYLSHEASVKSIGSLHFLSVVYILVAFVAIALSNQLFGGGVGSIRFLAVLVYFLGLLALNLAMGIGLRGLKPWARWTEVLLTILSICASLIFAGRPAAVRGGEAAGVIVFFTIIPAYILYLLLSKKGAVVFSPEYREIIDRTRYIKYRSSWLLKGCLIALLLFMVIGIGLAILAPMMATRR
jgi:hypothetical protein